MRRLPLIHVLVSLLILVAAVAPLILGTGTLYLRDIFTSHYEMKVAQAREMADGYLPIVDLYRAGGQPLLGNPNALPLYPDNVLYLVASPLWAMNAHFWLHLLVAPFAGYWLGRAWRLSKQAAWAVGVTYTASGFFLSLFNLFNLVAGAALAPAFIAACLDSRGGARRQLAAAGLLWTLLLLGGDPFFAALTLGLAVLALALAPSEARPQSRRRLFALAAALALGTAVAAPMLVELVRILPMSYRGYWRYSLEAALSQSWDPRSSLEWLVPFVFGRPDLSFWGQRFYGGNPPLLFSVFPGVLALALVALAGRPRGRAAVWGWLSIGGGLFFALGAWNPAVQLLYHLPGAAVLRYPVKFWLAIALGASLLCGIGFSRAEESPRHRRLLLGMLLGASAGYLALAIFVSSSAGRLLRGLDPARLDASALTRELAYGRTACIMLALTALVLAAATWLWQRGSAVGVILLFGVHLASQSLLLEPLIDADDVTPYVTPPPALASVPETSRVVHGGYSSLFGSLEDSPELRSRMRRLPDSRLFWLTRAHFAQLYPFSGVQWGRRYELNHSPEGLDSFFVISLDRAMQRMNDADRLRILRASGVDILLLDRGLDPIADDLARLVAHFPGSPLDLFVYAVQDPASAVQLPGTIRRAPQMNAALAVLTDPAFDPRSMAVLPGEGPDETHPPGSVQVIRRTPDELEVEAHSPEGGVVVWQRAFLALYRASIDGAPAVPTVANFHRIGVELGPGSHRVRIWIDRRPTAAAFLASVLALAALLALAFAPRRASSHRPEA